MARDNEGYMTSSVYGKYIVGQRKFAVNRLNNNDADYTSIPLEFCPPSRNPQINILTYAQRGSQDFNHLDEYKGYLSQTTQDLITNKFQIGKTVIINKTKNIANNSTKEMKKH